MLFQGSALFDSLSVEENVAFPLRMFTKMTGEGRESGDILCPLFSKKIR
ncbi:hypothetical protein N9K77_01810 [bacterium]|nr:hypothetical protein [bacterium]